jgi:hypothetical protein
MLVLSTSNRLIHVVARVRDLSDRFELLTQFEDSKRQAEKQSMIISQLELLTSRARLLQRSLTTLYSAIGFFVLTTFDIGITATSPSHPFGNAAVILGLLGTGFLCYSSVLLILEARRAFDSTKREMDFCGAWVRVTPLRTGEPPAVLPNDYVRHHNEYPLVAKPGHPGVSCRRLEPRSQIEVDRLNISQVREPTGKALSKSRKRWAENYRDFKEENGTFDCFGVRRIFETIRRETQ